MLHSLPNLIFGDSDDVVDKFPNMLEISHAYTLSSQPVRHRSRDFAGRELNDLSRAETCLRIGRQLRLNSDDLNGRLAQLDRGGHAADHPAAANRSQNHVYIGQSVEDFQSHRPLTGNDVLIVIWRNDHVSVFSA